VKSRLWSCHNLWLRHCISYPKLAEEPIYDSVLKRDMKNFFVECHRRLKTQEHDDDLIEGVDLTYTSKEKMLIFKTLATRSPNRAVTLRNITMWALITATGGRSDEVRSCELFHIFGREMILHHGVKVEGLITATRDYKTQASNKPAQYSFSVPHRVPIYCSVFWTWIYIFYYIFDSTFSTDLGIKMCDNTTHKGVPLFPAAKVERGKFISYGTVYNALSDTFKSLLMKPPSVLHAPRKTEPTNWDDNGASQAGIMKATHHALDVFTTSYAAKADKGQLQAASGFSTNELYYLPRTKVNVNSNLVYSIQHQFELGQEAIAFGHEGRSIEGFKCATALLQFMKCNTEYVLQTLPLVQRDIPTSSIWNLPMFKTEAMQEWTKTQFWGLYDPIEAQIIPQEFKDMADDRLYASLQTIVASCSRVFSEAHEQHQHVRDQVQLLVRKNDQLIDSNSKLILTINQLMKSKNSVQILDENSTPNRNAPIYINDNIFLPQTGGIAVGERTPTRSIKPKSLQGSPMFETQTTPSFLSIEIEDDVPKVWKKLPSGSAFGGGLGATTVPVSITNDKTFPEIIDLIKDPSKIGIVWAPFALGKYLTVWEIIQHYKFGIKQEETINDKKIVYSYPSTQLLEKKFGATWRPKANGIPKRWQKMMTFVNYVTSQHTAERSERDVCSELENKREQLDSPSLDSLWKYLKGILDAESIQNASTPAPTQPKKKHKSKEISVPTDRTYVVSISFIFSLNELLVTLMYSTMRICL
jgi:hypothetical protein